MAENKPLEQGIGDLIHENFNLTKAVIKIIEISSQ